MGQICFESAHLEKFVNQTDDLEKIISKCPVVFLLDWKSQQLFSIGVSLYTSAQCTHCLSLILIEILCLPSWHYMQWSDLEYSHTTFSVSSLLYYTLEKNRMLGTIKKNKRASASKSIGTCNDLAKLTNHHIMSIIFSIHLHYIVHIPIIQTHCLSYNVETCKSKLSPCSLEKNSCDRLLQAVMSTYLICIPRIFHSESSCWS